MVNFTCTNLHNKNMKYFVNMEKGMLKMLYVYVYYAKIYETMVRVKYNAWYLDHFYTQEKISDQL